MHTQTRMSLKWRCSSKVGRRTLGRKGAIYSIRKVCACSCNVGWTTELRVVVCTVYGVMLVNKKTTATCRRSLPSNTSNTASKSTYTPITSHPISISCILTNDKSKKRGNIQRKQKSGGRKMQIQQLLDGRYHKNHIKYARSFGGMRVIWHVVIGYMS